MATKGQSRAHIKIHGGVQGVFFRAGARKRALELNLTGWVCNLMDGSVEVVAEGTIQSLRELIAWCRKGPPGTHVVGIDVRDEIYSGEFDSFKIKY